MSLIAIKVYKVKAPEPSTKPADRLHLPAVLLAVRRYLRVSGEAAHCCPTSRPVTLNSNGLCVQRRDKAAYIPGFADTAG